MKNELKGDELVFAAERIARKAHNGQTRRDWVTPYIQHPWAVQEKLRHEGPDVQATAWLHDVIEDTDVTAEDLIREGIPQKVVDAVLVLTKPRGQTYEQYLDDVRDNKIARKVKVADMLHNLSDSPTRKQILKYAHGLQWLLS